MQVRPDILGETVAFKDKQPLNRPTSHVLNGRWELFFGRARSRLSLAFKTQSQLGVRIRDNHIDLADGSPQSTSNTNLAGGIQSEFSRQFHNRDFKLQPCPNRPSPARH